MSNLEIPFSHEEIARRDDESYYWAFVRLFNNFFNLFPLGEKPYPSNESPQGAKRGLEAKNWDVVRKNNGIGVFGDNDEHANWYTDKYRNQTPHQFYNEVDQIICECGFTVEKVAEIVNDAYLRCERPLWKRKLENRIPPYKRLMQRTREKKWKLMFETLLPVYVELRHRGYSHYELCS